MTVTFNAISVGLMPQGGYVTEQATKTINTIAKVGLMPQGGYVTEQGVYDDFLNAL